MGKCKPVTTKDVTAPAHDGNVPKNAVDNKAASRWSTNQVGAWIELEFHEAIPVDSIEMSFYKGDDRAQYFDIYGDGKPLLMNMESSGKTLGLQHFPLKEATVVKTLTIFGNGNSMNGWNSVTEVAFCGAERSAKAAHDDPTGEEDECDTFNLEIASVKASSDDGHKAESVLGSDLKTHWSCKDSPGELFNG